MLPEFTLIAEIGGNHEGDFLKAKELADLAISAGARVIKFQIYTGNTLVSVAEDPNRAAHFDKFALKKSQYIELAEYVQSRGAIFNASIWTEDWINEFDKYLTFYKIGSGDLTAYPVIEKIASIGKPIIISTGLSTLEEVKDAMAFIIKKNSLYSEPGMLGILQCSSMYPIPLNEANLAVMDVYRKEFPFARIGYSDHTIGNAAVKLAVARGAEIIEVHFSDNNKQAGFRDHLVSLEPADVAEVLRYQNEISQMIGSGVKSPTRSEIESGHVSSFRRGLYIKTDKAAGTIISREDLIALRPNHGIDARSYESIIGKKLIRDVAAYEQLELSYFK